MVSQKALCALALFGFASAASADPIVTILYAPNVAFSTVDKTAIQNAVDFYTANMSSDFSVTIAFGSQAAGGATSNFFVGSLPYGDYYNTLVGNASGDATDTAAIASLGGPSATNPVTGTGNIVMTSTLAVDLGFIGSQPVTQFGTCDNLIASACIDLSTTLLNISGTPAPALEGVVQHEFDEVLGTASALPNGGTGDLPTNPMVADLYRYSGNGQRSFALNSSTSVPCTGSPTAYFSVDGGASHPNGAVYNNCNNGGDYGDWINTGGQNVQDAYGSNSQTVTLNLHSPEVQVLDAVGFNFGPLTPTPEPSSYALLLSGLGVLFAVRKRRLS